MYSDNNLSLIVSYPRPVTTISRSPATCCKIRYPQTAREPGYLSVRGKNSRDHFPGHTGPIGPLEYNRQILQVGSHDAVSGSGGIIENIHFAGHKIRLTYWGIKQSPVSGSEKCCQTWAASSLASPDVRLVGCDLLQADQGLDEVCIIVQECRVSRHTVFKRMTIFRSPAQKCSLMNAASAMASCLYASRPSTA